MNSLAARLAIEALAWISSAETMRDLAGLVPGWPLGLREHWYLAAAAIRERTEGFGSR